MASGALLLPILAMNYNSNDTTLIEKTRSRKRGLSKLMLSGKLYHKHDHLLFFFMYETIQSDVMEIKRLHTP